MGTWMAWANEDPSKLLCKRTCNFIFRSTWHGAKPRTPTTTILFLHGCHNLVFITIILFRWHGKGLSREPLHHRFHAATSFGIYLNLFLVVIVCIGITSHYSDFTSEIYFRSLFLIQLHVRGFSSQRITSMIHFLSSVCKYVCIHMFIYADFWNLLHNIA
jgi:hypothetical protein